MTSSGETGTTATRGRQRPGGACDECRRRKLRCDGQQPQCKVCRDTGVLCEVTQRGTRGPKKGHMKILKNRILYLEALLEGHEPSPQRQQDIQNSDTPSRDETLPASPVYVAGPNGVDNREPLLPNASTTFSGLDDGLAFQHHESSFLSTLQTSNSYVAPTAILHGELDQLYFDRVHQSIPILHQRRYLSWSKSSTKTASRRCLQYAMWALASLLSAQFRNIMEPLYQETKRLLEHVSLGDDDDSSVSTELAQAWVLVATFESMRTYHRQAWMSAGRAFRLVQAMHYHEIDSPTDRRGASSSSSDDFIEVEERRRVFWMAYLLDHIISMRNDWPITLNEHVICTRLPAPDEEFQNGHHALGPFLSDAMTDSTLQLRSLFNECLVLATICGRGLLQSQRYNISKVYGDMVSDWAAQHSWLDSLLAARLHVLLQFYPSPTESCDPLLLFANILAQATIVYLSTTRAESAAMPETRLLSNSQMSGFQNQDLEACENVVNLATTLCELPSSKIHPLMPMPLFLCAEFLYNNIHSDERFGLHLRKLLHIFRELKNVNDHEQSYLDSLQRSCLSKTKELISHSVE